MFTASQLLDKINNYLSRDQIIRIPERLHEPIGYILSLGGKRIRPVLIPMAYSLYKEDVSSVYDPTTDIGVYHNHTLLHDDLTGRSDMRRGKPTAHRVWNDGTTILSGDTMLTLAFQHVAGCAPEHLRETIDLPSLTTLEIYERQQLDMGFESRNDMARDEYIEITRLKTATLLTAGLKIGAILAGASVVDAGNLYNFGMQIGVALQLQDNLLSVCGNPEVFGRRIGGDVFYSKKTYMLTKALEHTDEEQLEELNCWLNTKNRQLVEKIAAVTEIYSQLTIHSACGNKICEYYTLVMENLEAITVTEKKGKGPENLVRLLMYREI